MGSGGFSLIYLARDEDSRDQVVIKEYLPKKLAMREEDQTRVSVISEARRDAFHHGRKLFYQEAKALATLRHPNIVRVRNFFGEQYGLPGHGLRARQKPGRLHQEAGRRAEYQFHDDRVSACARRAQSHPFPRPAAPGHQAEQHPPTPRRKPLLLDFGAVHQSATTRSDQPSQVVTPGFSPLEQYYASGYVGPWSDVYAIGASMRACLDGKPPPSAMSATPRTHSNRRSACLPAAIPPSCSKPSTGPWR